MYVCVSLSLLLLRMCKRYTVSHAGERWECLAAAVGQEEEMFKLQHGEEADDCWCQVVLKVKTKSLYSTITNSEVQPEARSVLETENVFFMTAFYWHIILIISCPCKIWVWVYLPAEGSAG